MKGTGNSAGLRIGGEETITFVKAVKKYIWVILAIISILPYNLDTLSLHNALVSLLIGG